MKLTVLGYPIMAFAYKFVRPLLAVGVLVFALLGVSPAGAQPLVTPAWVQQNLKLPGLVFLDIRAFESYSQGHIPGAVPLPYNPNAWRLRFPLSAGSPSPERAFSARVAVLGIGTASHVVIIHAGRVTQDVASATHIYWTFKLMGHDKVSILHGGMPNYRRQLGVQLETVSNFPRVAVYRPNPSDDILAREEDIERALAEKTLLIDYRAFGHFLGINKIEGVARYGTLPGARSFPLQWTTVDGGGQLRTAAQLTRIYDQQKIDINSPHIAFSDVGQLASLGWFIAHELLGNKTARLYAGGMLEWSANPARPVFRRIIFE